jgi:hypothetical protein
VAAQHPEVAAELRQLAKTAGGAVLAERGKDDRPSPVGHAPRTELPAGDGVASGSVERSNRFPNSSYFTRWTATDGAITWDVEVAQPGEYEAVLAYACPAADTGATVELAFGGSKVSARVAEAHDPPVIGAAHDRIPRAESYIKDWKTLSLGTIRLDKARGPLTLRATEIPGKQALEVWSLTLTRR